MIKKQLIYYARTYRHLKQSITKNILYCLLLVLPFLLLLYLNLYNITNFISSRGARILGEIFPGIPIQIADHRFPFFHDVCLIDMPTVYPEFPFIIGNMIFVFGFIFLIVVFGLMGRPVPMYIMVCMVTHVVSCIYFIFAPNCFPYMTWDFSELYIAQQIAIWIVFAVLSGLTTAIIGGHGYVCKVITYLVIMLYSLIFGGVRYIVFLFFLQKFSMLYMAVMFFVLGPMFDFLYLVCIYSFFINKMTKCYDTGAGRSEWEWS